MTEQHQAKPFAAEPKEKIDYLQPPLAYLVRIPVPDAEADSPLGEAARGRAEDAARWLSFQPIAVVVCGPNAAADETAEIMLHGGHIVDKISEAQLGTSLMAFIKDRGPHALVLRQQEIEAALEGLGVQSTQVLLRRLASANVCAEVSKEIVAPGGVITIHEMADGFIARARTRILDFSFTDFVHTVAETEQ